MIRRNSDVGFADVQYNNRGARSALISGSRTDYGYDPAGRLETLTQNVGGVAQDVTYGFGYNPASQMTSRTTGNDIYVWTGAVNVNRAYAVNGLNQYTSAGNTNFAYDANGNLTQSGITAYTYDIENRLVGVSGGLSTSLRYDPLGRLFEVAGPSSTTRFLYDGDELVAEYDGTGSMLRRYVHGLGSDDPMAWFEGAGVGEGAARFIKSDHQGSVTALVARDGSLLHINRYDEWGIPGTATQPNTGRFQYTGQIWIPEIGLYYYKARLYSPSLGRFMQTDPIGYDDGLNIYAYVGNDPVNFSDPSGMVKCTGDNRCEEVHQAAEKAKVAVEGASAALKGLAAAVKSGADLTQGQQSVKTAYESKFGVDSATAKNLSSTAKTFDKMAAKIGDRGSGVSIKFADVGGSIATAAVGGNSITLGPRFFGQLGGTGGLSQSFVVMHEAGHSAGLRDQFLPSSSPGNIGRNGRAYGVGATSWLAQNYPGVARKNNDNYQCFADPFCGGP